MSFRRGQDPSVGSSRALAGLLLALLLVSGCRSQLPNLAVVERVIDGDTIKLEDGTRIRYIGINTPETVHPNEAIQFMGKEASELNKKLVLGKTVRLEYDVEHLDKYGRTLAYVYVDTLFINAELIRRGYAQTLTIPPNLKHADIFVKLQQEARREERGLWNEGRRREWESTRPQP